LTLLDRVYPIVRKVESDATGTAVKSWVEIVHEYDEQQREAARPEPASGLLSAQLSTEPG
jgi:hypothetical protein